MKKINGGIAISIMELGLALFACRASAATTLSETFYGGVTTFYANGQSNTSADTIFGTNVITYGDQGQIVDFTYSWAMTFSCCGGYTARGPRGSYDFNIGNDSSSPGNGSRTVEISSVLKPTEFKVTASDIVAAFYTVEHYTVVDLDLAAGSGWIQEYYLQPGYASNEIVYFDLWSVNDHGAPFPSPLGGVPEASTWSMMLLGFGGLGFAGYRRSQRKVGLSYSAV